MARPLPHRPSVDHTPRYRAVVTLDNLAAGDVTDALGSETARDLVRHLQDQAATASDLADRVDTTLQNVQYHLKRLRAADLVTQVDTWYSAKGREMSVYGLTAERIELRLAADETSTVDPTPAGARPARTPLPSP